MTDITDDWLSRIPEGDIAYAHFTGTFRSCVEMLLGEVDGVTDSSARHVARVALDEYRAWQAKRDADMADRSIELGLDA